MFRRKAIGFLSSFALSILVVSVICVPHSTIHAQNQASWTIMFYSTADTSDIEAAMLRDVNEIEWVGSTADVNLVAQVDRTNADPSWTDARRFLLQKDTDPETVTSPVLESLGEVDMGDPNTLVDFVMWAATNFPADHYALILSDHGGAWTGEGWDASSGFDQLTMPELDQAFSQITETLGGTFDLIGFDACLMSQFDVIRLLAPYADYAVLAEETEPGYGWAYDLSLPSLIDNPSMSAADLGKAFVDGYYYSYAEGPFKGMEDRYDLNLIDLSRVADADAAFDTFIQATESSSSDVLGAIGNARNNTVYFGGRTPDEADAISSVDLIHFLSLLEDLSPNGDVDQAAQALIDATNGLIAYHAASPSLDKAHGISVYFPTNALVYQSYGANYPREVSYMSDWQSFLTTFYGAATAANPPGSLSDVITIQGVYPADTVSIHQPPVVLFDTNGQNILEVSFSATLQLDDGTLIMLDQSPLESSEVTESGETIVSFPDGPQQNQFTWGAEMPVITDGVVSIPTLLISDRNDPNAEIVSGEYYTPDGESVTAYLIFDIETQTVSEVWGVSDNGGAPFNIQPKPGDQFLPTWRFFDADGNLSLIPADSDPLTFGSESFSYYYEPAISGTYLFVIRVEDVAGNVYTDATTITVDNENLDINYRGYTDIDLGLSFLYPWDWPEPVYVVADDGSSQTIISDADGNINIYVTAYDATSSDDILSAAYDYLDNIDNVAYDEADEEPVTIWGYDGTIIPYSFTVDGEPHVGAVLAIYVPDLETGFLVDLDTLESMMDQGETVFDTMIGSLSFFTPPDVTP
jgi:hypothetical protein